MMMRAMVIDPHRLGRQEHVLAENADVEDADD